MGLGDSCHHCQGGAHMLCNQRPEKPLNSQLPIKPANRHGALCPQKPQPQGADRRRLPCYSATEILGFSPVTAQWSRGLLRLEGREVPKASVMAPRAAGQE